MPKQSKEFNQLQQQIQKELQKQFSVFTESMSAHITTVLRTQQSEQQRELRELRNELKSLTEGFEARFSTLQSTVIRFSAGITSILEKSTSSTQPMQNYGQSAPASFTASTNCADVRSTSVVTSPIAAAMASGSGMCSTRIPADMEDRGQTCGGASTEKQQHMLNQLDISTQAPNDLHLPRRAFCQYDIAPYEGKTSWVDYSCLVEHTANFYGWSSSEKVMAVIANLRGEAFRLISALPVTPPPSWEQLNNLFTEKFTVPAQVSYQEFKRRVQGPREGLTEFATALELLAAAAFPNSPPSFVTEALKIQFIDGLRDSDLMRLVVAGQPRTIKAALVAAQELSSRSDSSRSRPIFAVNQGTRNYSRNSSDRPENTNSSTMRSESRRTEN